MKQLAHLLLAVWLVALVTGCGGIHHYDGRLTAADSLMMPYPDSALALVTAIPDSALTTEGDRAYCDLLMTQARYKCYVEITASDDSAINRAMDYYRRHDGERDKLTRAYLYKGAVMEELGHVDSAMYYYKTAEAAADEKDYANLGQINTRIADLFRKTKGDAQISYEKYHLAYQYHVLAGDKKMQLNNLSRMFRMNGITQLDEQDSLFNQAINLARELENDRILFHLYELRCRQMSLVDSTQQEAKRIALYCLEDYGQFINNDLLLDLAYIYAKENKLDSAKYFLTSVDEALSPGDKEHVVIRKNDVLTIIALAEGNPSLSHQYTAISSQLTDSILDNTDKYGIGRIENEFNHRKQVDSFSRMGHLRYIIIGLSVITILIIVLFIAAYLRRIRKTKTIIKELENTKLDRHEELLNQLDAKNGVIERLLNNLVMLMKSADIKETQINSRNQLARQIKETIVDVANDDFWAELRTYLDKNHNGIISSLEQTYGFAEKDLRFIELSCCGFSHLEIAMIMNYSPKYVFNKRKVLASRMGIDIPFLDYIDSLMAN
jgi:hypothetical protein